MEEFELIAKTFQGLEEVLAKELTTMGANNIEIGRRMVSFTGNKEMLYRANFNLRTAIRILKPIKHFTAKSADEVYEAVKSIEWEQYLNNKMSFAVDAVVFSEEFRHSMFVAYKVKDAIVDYFRDKTGDRPSVRINNPDLALNIHIAQNKCTLSLDSSGESLHRRGYRQEAVEAPLNEVLAAGMILLTGWQGECDLIDPMCGSGTIPIEAALIARNIAPGVFRKEFAFEKWNDFDQELFDKIYNDDSQEREFTHKIYGYDNSPKANEIATHNVKAAGLTKDIVLKLQPFQQFEAPTEKSVIITNPPYGERISTNDLLGLYQMIGERLKHEFTDNDAWILSYRTECFDQIGLKPSAKIPLFNGALECEFRKYQLFSGKYKEYRENGDEEFKPRQETNGEEGEQDEKRERRYDKGRTFGDRERKFDRGERRFDRGERTSEDGERKFGDRGQDRRERRFGDRERTSGDGERKFDRGERRFDRGERTSDGGERKFGDRGQDRRERRFGDRERTFGDRERKFGDRGDRTFDRGERKFDRGERYNRGERDADRRNPDADGNEGRSYERRERSYDKSRTFGDRNQDRKERSFGDRERKFGDRERKFGDRERKFGDRGERTFDRNSRPADKGNFTAKRRMVSRDRNRLDKSSAHDKNQNNSYEENED